MLASNSDEPGSDPLRGPFLEAGLKAAFGSSTPASQPPGRASVYDLLARLGSRPQRVLLREPRGEDEPIVKPTDHAPGAPPAAAGRYQLLGEIARGGIGVVLRGHDVDLGRDVALKVLRDDHRDNASLLERFVEEAQIGGQLQHPGIAPVYELGVGADERPFFAMKLIKGESLAALLARRAAPADERRRFLGVFEQVCQALAYAHARGVVHRDLKPSNVMVGAFGEVQVVDWGLAKVLARGGVADERRTADDATPVDPAAAVKTVRSRPGSSGSDSIAGSVMGTPGYMAPEQARGAIDEIDERSDVFALGAILCEILTGRPPFTGERSAALAAAAAARLADAFARLADCAADPELVALCKRCLAPRRRERPRDAAQVAAQIGAHLASVEERARAAQIAAARAEVKAREERRARRLTLALASSGIVTLVVAGGGWAWVHGKSVERIATTERSVRAALSDAALARGARNYVESLAGITRARALLEAGEATAALRDEVRRTAAGIESEADAAKKAAELESANRDLLAKLEQLRRPESRVFISADGGLFPTDWAQVAADYAAVFHAAGLSPDSSAVQDAAAAIRARGIPVQLASAIDPWARACLAAKKEEERRHLIEVSIASDTDPDRVRLRKALLDLDLQDLHAFAQEKNLRDLPPGTLLRLVGAFYDTNDLKSAADVCRVGQRAHPADRELTVALARRLMDLSPPQAREAAELYRAAIALEPDRVELRCELAEVLGEGLGDAAAATGELEDARQLDPSDTHVVCRLGYFLARSGHVDDAIRRLEENARAHPDSAEASDHLGIILRQKGDLDRAIEADRRTIRLAPSSSFGYTHLGHALLDKGSPKEALEPLLKATQLDPPTSDAFENLGLARLRTGDFDGAIAALRAAAKLEPSNAQIHANLGLALHRKKEFTEAIDEFRTALRLQPGMATAQRDLGATLARTGRTDEAIPYLLANAQLNPGDAGAQNDAGAALCSCGRFDEAIHFLETAARLRPTEVRIHVNLGSAFQQFGSFRRAIAQFREAMRIDSSFPGTPAVLAGILEACPDPSLRNPKEALQVAELATRLAAEDPDSWACLGAACCRNQQWERAVPALERVLKERREDVPAALFLAMALHHLDRDDEARESFDKAVDGLEKAASKPAPDEPDPMADSPDEPHRLKTEVAALLGLADEGASTKKGGDR